MWHGFEGIGWGWIGLGAVHMLLFWAVFIFLFVAGVRWLSGSGPEGTDVLEILKARYARGEITREEFEKLKRELLDPDRPDAGQA